MDNNKCKFCDEYKILKSYSIKHEREMAAQDLPIKETFHACIQIERERLGWGVRDAGITTYRQFPLIYCPMCGKKLEE